MILLNKLKLKAYPLRFILMIFGLSTALPLTYITAGFGNISFHLLAAALYLSVCFILFINFHGQKNASFYCFILRLVLAVSIGFGVFIDIPLIVKIIISVYSLLLLSVLTYAISDRFHYIGAFCFVMLMLNFVIGVIIRLAVTHIFNEQFLNILIIISTVAVLSFFLILNIDNARWFGPDKLSIPVSVKRSSFVILAVVGAVITLISFSSFIIDALGSLIRGIFLLIDSLLGLFASNGQLYEEQPYPADGMRPFDGDFSAFEPASVNPVLTMIVAGIFFAVLIALFTFALIKFIKYIVRLFKSGRSTGTTESGVFSEVIEKIVPNRKKRSLREYIGQPRYSSLQTERERILFIYRKYVKRAKQSGFTQNDISDTPYEVLEEISGNASGERFPLPENLGAVFNAARYGNDSSFPVTADDLKRRLL